jgi:tetratricopeptide (TPR) repeat protein
MTHSSDTLFRVEAIETDSPGGVSAPNDAAATLPPNALPLSGHRVSFTGVLASMTHREAAEVVAKNGGVSTTHVSRQTTLVVVGEEGWPLEPDGQPSVKILQAVHLGQQGCPIRVVKESDWLEWVGLSQERQHIHRRYTPATLSRSLKCTVHEIRRWERMGLIRPVERVHRLPYFDFQEVASVRRLAQLVSSGISPERIRNSLNRLSVAMPHLERPLQQLEVLGRKSDLLFRDSHGGLRTASGQRILDFGDDSPLPHRRPAARATDSFDPDSPDKEFADNEFAEKDSHPDIIRMPGAIVAVTSDADHTAEDWFEIGCAAADAGDLQTAETGLRRSLHGRADCSDAHARLADVLYRRNNVAGAIERYSMAVELDAHFLEAWTQLGCLHAEVGEHERAVKDFEAAIALHPNYADAHLHLAKSLDELNRPEEAEAHWSRYLELDSVGPWSELARQRLKLDE